MSHPAAIEHPTDEDLPVSQVQAAAIVLRLRSIGIADRRLLRAMEMVPRALFVPAELSRHAASDRDIPIPCGQTLSAPSTVAQMIAALELGDRHSVLEVGTGSGYQTAILCRLARRVTTIERFRTLSRSAEHRFAALNIRNATVLVGDGLAGWPAQAPFDRIVVAAACERPPMRLLHQLPDGGLLVAPIEIGESTQRLTVFCRRGQRITTRDAGAVRMPAIVSGMAQSL